MNTLIPIAIVTRNRPREVVHCLASLTAQTRQPNQICVVENNSEKKIEQTIQNIAKKVKYELIFVLEKKINTATARNKAISTSKKSWLAFIDDDCIALPSWYQAVQASISRYSSVGAIIGESHTLYGRNIWSLLTSYKEKKWKKKWIVKEKVMNPMIFDTKNCVINLDFFKKNKLKFDKQFSKYVYSTIEDCDMGLQIGQLKEVFFSDRNIVLHRDQKSLFSYIRKSFFKSLSYSHLEKKWQAEIKKYSQKIQTKNTYTIVNFLENQLQGSNLLLKTILNILVALDSWLDIFFYRLAKVIVSL